jgi:tellurite resistance protein TerC
MIRSYKGARKVVVAVVGSTVLLLGIAMIVLPGPAVLVIPLGLGVLAIEFAWARRWLHRMQEAPTAALARLQAIRTANGACLTN